MRVKSIVETVSPLTTLSPKETAVTALLAEPTVTAKSVVSGDPDTVSLITKVTFFVPPAASADEIVGKIASITMSEF